MKRKLQQLSKSATPSRSFEKRLLERLDARFASSVPKGVHRKKRAWAAGVLSVGFLLSGTSTYAYASPDVTPESTLYPVKTGIESVEERFRRSPESRAAFHARMAERRSAEHERSRIDTTREGLRTRITERIELGEEELLRIEEHMDAPHHLRGRLEAVREHHQIESRVLMEELIEQAVEDGVITEVEAQRIEWQIQEAPERELQREPLDPRPPQRQVR